MKRKLLIQNTSPSAINADGLLPSGASRWIDAGNLRDSLIDYIVGNNDAQIAAAEAAATTGSCEPLIGVSVNTEGELVATGEWADTLSINEAGELVVEVAS